MYTNQNICRQNSKKHDDFSKEMTEPELFDHISFGTTER